MGKRKHRLFAIICVIVFMLTLCVGTISGYAETATTTQTGKIVNCQSFVNVRSGPGTGYVKIGTAPKGATYTVTGQAGSYYRINYNGRTGYVYSRYLSVSTAQPTDSQVGKIVNCRSFVNVRSGPSVGYIKIGTAPKGATYTVTGKVGSYYKIDYNGRTGYVYASYLSIISSPPQPQPQPQPQPPTTSLSGKIINCNSYVNVRSGPGLVYAKIGTAPKNAVYSVYEQIGSYYKINYNGRTGYVYSAYLSISSEQPQPPEASQIGKIVNCNSYVNVRSGPSASYNKIGTAPKNATYNVLGKSNLYYKIDYNGRTGYVYYRYVAVTSAPTPTPTPQPTPTPTPVPTAPPQPTPTPVPQPTATPVPQPTATPVPTPSPTPESTPTPQPTATPVPTPEPTPQPTEGKVLLGYYASWAAYSGYTPLRIPADKVTHINYAFANIDDDLKITMGDPAIDPSNFAKLRELKQAYPHLKTLISVGGWTWSDKFSDAALTEQSRNTFADSIVAFITQHGFDGVDLDWEYPVGGGLSSNSRRPEDKTNFTLLMAKIREKLDEQGGLDNREYLLTFAGAAGTFYANNVELSKLADYVDYAIIMTYDIHGPWPGSLTDFNAPLFNPKEYSPQYKWSADSSVKLYQSRGFPKSKILMGVPFYGIKYNSVLWPNDGLYQPFGSGSSISYDRIMRYYYDDLSFDYFVHPDAQVPWLFDGDTFISYDDEDSIAAKGQYIKDQDLGGAAVWELSQNTDGTLINTLSDNID